MTETRKLAAILVSDVVGYSRLAGADEEDVLARLRALRRELIDPKIALHKGRVVKSTGDGVIVEFRSAVDAVRAAIEVQTAMVDRNVGIPEDRQIVLRIGVHVGDVVEESDGDLMGDGVNIAARLEGVAQPGSICLSEAAYWQVKSRLDLAITDLGETKLKNIAEPIRAYSLQVGAPTAPKAAAKPAPSEKPSIAALPFQNMSGDPEQEYFVDGLVEDILTGLARVKLLTVIARNSSFVYKGKAVDVRQVGRELGARYVLEGSVRKGGARLRITAQLIEAETGAHLWAEKFDGALDDVFELQDQITERIVGVIEPSVRKSEIERSRRKPPENLAAYDLCLRAAPYLVSPNYADASAAGSLLEQALRLDPLSPAAHAALAHSHEQRFHSGGFDPAERAAGIAHAETVIASKTDDANALATAGFVVFLLAHDYELSQAAIERALSQNPCCVTALLWGAFVYACSGQSERGAAFAERAMRISPLDQLTWHAHLCLGHARLRQGRDEEAVAHYGMAMNLNPQYGVLHHIYAAGLALTGRIDEARQAVTRGLEINPNIRFGLLMPRLRDKDLKEKMARGLRLAGSPE
jgi:adenylate cyclase